MKIHIVQKGDTIWDIAEKYGVDVEEVIELNPQISSPDMIMPGMKIKIPSTSKQVKPETGLKEEQIKEKPIETPQHIPHKPIQMVTEDDHKQLKEIPLKEPIGIVKDSPKLAEHPKISMPLMPIIPGNMIDEEMEYEDEEEIKLEKVKNLQPKVKTDPKEMPQLHGKGTIPTDPNMQIPLETPKDDMEGKYEPIPYPQPFMPTPVMPCYCHMVPLYQPCGWQPIQHSLPCCGHPFPYQMQPIPYGAEQQYYRQNIPMQASHVMTPFFGYNVSENALPEQASGPQYGHMPRVRSDQNLYSTEGDRAQSLEVGEEKSSDPPPIYPSINDFESFSDY